MSEVTYPKSGTLDPGLLVGPQTRDPRRKRWDPRHETRDPKSGT